MEVIRLHHGLLHKPCVCTCTDKWWYTLTASVRRVVSSTNYYRTSLLPICAHMQWRWKFIKKLQNHMWWVYDDVCKPRVSVRRTCSKAVCKRKWLLHTNGALSVCLRLLATVTGHIEETYFMTVVCPFDNGNELNLQTFLIKNCIILTNGMGDFKKQRYGIANLIK